MPTRVASSQAPSRTLATLRLLLFSLSTRFLCISPSLSRASYLCYFYCSILWCAFLLQRIAAARAAAEAFCLHLIIIVATVLPTYTCTRAYPGSWSKPHTKRGVCRLPSYCENIIHCTFLLHHFYRPSLCALAPLSTPLVSCTCKLALWQCDNKML